MGVQRFRTLEEAERALRLPPGDPGILKQMRAVAALARLCLIVRPERGVRKFRTIEEANRDREEWEQRNFQAAQARVVRPSNPQ